MSNYYKDTEAIITGGTVCMRAESSEGGGGGVDGTVRIVPSAAGAEAAVGESLFNQYAVVGRIGDGGMGVVYLARDRRLNRYVAIKRLNNNAQGIASLRQRFLNEARAVAALSHIYIVHIYALGEDSDGPYIVMEYVAGPDEAGGHGHEAMGAAPAASLTLEQYVSRNGQMSVGEAIGLLVKVGRAMAYAHRSGVIHRDLKPGNILLDKSGEPKIVDFGLARLMHADEGKLTTPGEKLLSLGYGSPEQEQDASLTDERSDVYGLGALLYFAITGQNPRYFREQDIPVTLREVLVKALATDREQRWPSAEAFTEALQAVQNKTKIETPTVKTTWRCKWCDTVNPLSIRYCAECGWDGGESCPECGADTFVGVQYCGNCGADARAYESVRHLLGRMQIARDRKQFERVLTFASRAHGFEPAGPGGRQLVKEIYDLREFAERSLGRRERLKELVPIEIKAENYERATAFIGEYRELSGDTLAFSEEERQIPGQRLQRDLARAERCIRQGDRTTAEVICRDLLNTVAPGNETCMRLLRRSRARRCVRRCGVSVVVVLILFVGYILSLVPLTACGVYEKRGWVKRFYKPALHFYDDSTGVAGRVLAAYAARHGVGPFTFSNEGDTLPVISSEQLPELADLRRAFMVSLNELAVEERRFTAAWPDEYMRELQQLLERRQAAGDYDGVVTVQAELRQFGESRKIGASPVDEYEGVAALKLKYRQLLVEQRVARMRKRVATSRKYINELETLLRTHTREGRLDVAALLSDEIKGEKRSPELLEAEAYLANLPSGSSEGVTKVIGATPDAAGLAEIEKRRQQLDDKLVEIEATHEAQRALWPEQYLEALAREMERFQKAGDFDSWRNVDSERDRFAVDHRLALEDVVEESKPLRNLQLQHMERLRSLGQKRAAEIRTTFERHCGELEEWKRQLTRAGDMELAAVVNGEVQQLKTHKVYMAAVNVLTPHPETEGAGAGE